MNSASFFSLKAICFFSVFVLIGSVSSKNIVCPFDNLFHLGDGAFDIGNAMRIQPGLPASNSPYGLSHCGSPNGRWSDGYLDIDYGGFALGFPKLTPYLSSNASDNAVIFAVAYSPILDRIFFESRNVTLAPYAQPLSVQLHWFKDFINPRCSGSIQDCASTIGNSLFLFGNVEGNDIMIPLIQGKSLREVRTYVPFIVDAIINASIEVIQLGATRVIFTGQVPSGCYPYALTALRGEDSSAYDNAGCLKQVNNIIQHKNEKLKDAVDQLKSQYPNVTIFFADFYGAFELAFLNASSIGPNTLKACCGIGGKYNYDKDLFCGTAGVPVCDDPSKYVFWDGVHLTQYANYVISQILQKDALKLLGCTVPTSLFSSI